MMRYYSSTAGEMTLTAGIAAGDSSVQLDTVVGLPVSYPFTLFLDYGGSGNEEIVEVTSGSGTTLTVSRGVDGTSAQAHSLGAKVRHGMSARDLRESQQHIAGASGVHGVAGSVVGTTDAQTLTNKTLTSPQVDTPTITAPTATKATVTATGLDTPLTVRSQDAAGLNETFAEFRDSTDKVRVKVTRDATYIRDAAGNDLITLSGFGSTAKTVTVKNTSGVEVASVDKDGNLASPTVTALQSADTALDGRLDTIEGNLGSQTTFAATSAAKDGKRIHWGTATVTTDGSGYAEVTHGAGFTPSMVQVTGGNPTAQNNVLGADTFGATTFRVRAVSGGGAPVATSVVVNYICGE